MQQIANLQAGNVLSESKDYPKSFVSFSFILQTRHLWDFQNYKHLLSKCIFPKIIVVIKHAVLRKQSREALRESLYYM